MKTDTMTDQMDTARNAGIAKDLDIIRSNAENDFPEMHQ